MVNPALGCDDAAMRRTVPRILVASLALLAACATPKDRDLARYYDPAHLFSARLPAANTITVVPPQQVEDGASLLSGVISEPPLPSPSPQSQFGGIGDQLGQPPTPPDQTIYEVFAVSTAAFEDLDDMAVHFITGAPTIDVREQRDVRMDGLPARLVVADAVQEGEVRAGVAVAMTLGREGTGYLLAAIFPPGQWEIEEPDFLRVLDSFRVGTPPLLRTYPIADGGA